MINYMHRKGLVIPHPGDQIQVPYEGAYIVANPGAYRWVVSYDFKAMYPSILASANISPETKFKGKTPPQGSYSKSVMDGVWYDNEKLGIIPEIVSMIVDDRDKYKELQKMHSNPELKDSYDPELAAFYKRKQEAYKIYANSIYGLLGNRYFQLIMLHL
jgi:DNA polymerase I